MLNNHSVFEVVSCSKPDSEIFKGKQFTHLNNKFKRIYPDGIKERIYCSNLMLTCDMGEFKIGDMVKITIEKI